MKTNWLLTFMCHENTMERPSVENSGKIFMVNEFFTYFQDIPGCDLLCKTSEF